MFAIYTVFEHDMLTYILVQDETQVLVNNNYSQGQTFSYLILLRY